MAWKNNHMEWKIIESCKQLLISPQNFTEMKQFAIYKVKEIGSKVRQNSPTIFTKMSLMLIYFDLYVVKRSWSQSKLSKKLEKCCQHL